MLDRSKFLKKLTDFTPTLFIDRRIEHDKAYKTWCALIHDPVLLQRVYEAHTEWSLPICIGNITQTYSIPLSPETYEVAAIDGSQIYPDRHQGTASYLVNLGIIKFSYGEQKSTCNMLTEPSIFIGVDQEGHDITPEMVDAQRTEEELRTIANLGVKNILFDGSLIFWHLTTEDMQKRFLQNYVQAMQKWHEADLQCAGYISLPKSKEFVHMIRTALLISGSVEKFEHTLDADIMDQFLPIRTRSAVFANKSPIIEQYPTNVQPYFFYMNTGFEIARIEIPMYLAQSPEKVDALAALIMDQITKGFGYPICLSEAHEQAVIKNYDRDFFYHTLQQKTCDAGHVYNHSQKSLKKRSPAI